MSESIAIRVSHLSKRYQLGVQKSSSLREALTRIFQKKNESRSFLALDDVSFEVTKGKAIGVIGKNGAGKSTLLKLLSQITRPTSGTIEVDGRIVSLLEVGTGFHPELTGRENIYLNGTLLGMTRAEVKSKFDEIVTFSGVEKFIDTPVKNYSSGMYVRLAFAVAAHLESEILIVDEVLAVGDSEFQKKCLGKMSEVSSQGRTVLFVSHNLATLNSLCSEGILLDKGKIICTGPVQEVIRTYTELASTSNELIETLHYFQEIVQITSLTINNSSSTSVYCNNGKLSFVYQALLTQDAALELDIHIKKEDELVASFSPFVFGETNVMSAGTYEIQHEIELPALKSGNYTIELTFSEPFKTWYCQSNQLIQLEVVNEKHHLFLNNPTLKWGSVLLPGSTQITAL
jgi:lipopolysaccharide transport system ATP-binding protein